MKQFVMARLKLVPAIAGFVLFYLQAYQVSNPNHYLSVVIAVLTVLGVHQVPNVESVNPPVEG